MSPENLMPPSAMTGTSCFLAASTASMMAVSCGMPTPATTRVVQIEPGPMPTLTASAPASISALVPSAVATLPAITCTRLDCFLMRVTALEDAAGMAVRGVDHDQINAGLDQPFGALEAIVANAGGGRHAQAAVLILAGIGVLLRLLDILDRGSARCSGNCRRPPAAFQSGAGAAVVRHPRV